MEIAGLVSIWVTTPYIDDKTDPYISRIIFINKRCFKGNVQQSFSGQEYKVYGEILNQMQKIYTSSPPPIFAKDNIYFAEPISVGTIDIDGVAHEIYHQGEAVAEKPKSQYIGVKRVINPTHTNIKFEPIQEIIYA